MARMQRCAPVALVLAVCIVSGSGQGFPQPRMPAFPALPKPGAASAGYQMLAPSSADAAAMAPSEEVQYSALAPAPIGTGEPQARPVGTPRPAPGPLSPYNPIFNPIISKTDPSAMAANMQTQGFGSYQTVTASNNGQVTTSPTTYGNTNGNNAQYSSNTQQNGNQYSSTYGQGGTNQYNTAQSSSSTPYNGQNGQTNQLGYQMAAPAPAPVQIGETNSMVHAVELAHQKAQTTPQLSFGQDGVTIQQPVVLPGSWQLSFGQVGMAIQQTVMRLPVLPPTLQLRIENVNHPDGITSGGNQFKVNEHGVILGNVGTGGSINMQNNGGVTIDPGTAGNLWNLARSAAQLYGRKLLMHTQ